MTENIREAFLKAFNNEDGHCSPAYFYGENASAVVTIMEMGLSLLHERGLIWRTNGFQIASYSYFHVDRAIDCFKDFPYAHGLFVVSSLELLVEDARGRGIEEISLEATAMGRPLYERYGFVSMYHEMELPKKCIKTCCP